MGIPTASRRVYSGGSDGGHKNAVEQAASLPGKRPAPQK